MPTSRTSALTGNNQQFTVHILQHQRENEAPRYTVSVWEESQLRAICHVSSLSGALLALSGELESATPSPVPIITYPKWSDIRELVEKLRGRKDSDSVAAANDLEDLQCRLHNAVGNFEVLLDHATKLGAVLEEAAANSRCVGDPQWTTVAIPEDIWFRLLAVYRGKQESNSIYSELQLLREIAVSRHKLSGRLRTGWDMPGQGNQQWTRFGVWREFSKPPGTESQWRDWSGAANWYVPWSKPALRWEKTGLSEYDNPKKSTGSRLQVLS